MNDRCPACGLVFEREPGYFTGAMYVSYALGIIATAPVYFSMLLAGQGAPVILAVTAAVVVVWFPLLFRYSRVIWMHIDRTVNPDEGVPFEGAQGEPQKGPERPLRS